ncbi:hypothetical protein BpHYR1_005373 [Brachionus plicatilis]|uniref:Uncharacterized protein n=1 Tax=Brachionus plicatilis TaxID=10195 RepID=A0A3M7RGQ8_BRAPC|nr:hypothetical protein BpHYR1_005373 [Brachionus plicatilis]
MSRFNLRKNSSFNDSDVSEADDDDIAKILRETEGLDSAKRKPNLSQTQPSLTRAKSFNFEDDPLDNLDELIGKKHTNTSTKPPLASTMPTPAKPKIGFIFDEDFDSNPKTNLPKQSDNTSKQKNLVDELFGKAKTEKNEAKSDDDFLFGNYMPSVASNTPRTTLSQPPAKRSVSFNDEEDHKPKAGDNLSKTTPGKLDLDFDFESLLKPKAKTNASTKNDDWMKEPTKFETSIDLDGSLNNPRRRNSQSGPAEKPPIGFKTGAKDSMNSSFADSTDNMDHANQNNKNFTLGNMQPLNFDVKTEEKTDGPDKWFTNLITNKKSTNQPKKSNVSNYNYF